MTNSINTNIAALFAQANIAAASNLASSSVARLSSGNRIVQASDDVAALAIGTSLGTQVSALKTAQTNASQGGSLLQVADGALAQIQSILQQQQSIANQAQSGSLTNTDRGFLNQQFQALANEINSLAGSTTFNGVNLIDGSIAAAGTVGSANPLVSTSADTTASSVVATATAATFGTDATTNTDASLLGVGVVHYTFGTVASTADHFSAATVISPVNGNASGNDTALSKTNLGAATVGVTVTSGSIDSTGAASTATTYTVNVTVGGIVYTGLLDMKTGGFDGSLTTTDGSVAGGTVVTLTATTGANTHATLTATVGATDSAGGDVSGALATNLQTTIRSASLVTGAFTTVAVAAPVATGSPQDAALQGDLSGGALNVFASSSAGIAGTVGGGGNATGYTVQYTLNGIVYQGVLANDTTPGHGTTGTGNIALAALTDQGSHSIITITAGTAFGTGQATVDQSANILDALKTKFATAYSTSTASSAVITGTTSTSGITAVVATDNFNQNDTHLVGDLSQGTFNVTGSNASGFTVAYTLNGSTYSGSLSSYKATNGGALILSNGTGSLRFTIGSAASATATTADVFKAALGVFLTSTTSGVTTGASALAIHSVATTLAKDASGDPISGSAITAASTTGTVIENFNGANVTLQSGSFIAGDSQVPPLSTFSATGTGTSTVFSVIINGETYTTGNPATSGLANDGGTSGVLNTVKFDKDHSAVSGSSAGILYFFKNGDDTSKDILTLDLHAIVSAAKISTASDVQNVVDALNGAFGSGGSTGGLSFQLGTTSASNVSVNIGSAETTALYGGVALDISTQTGAATAATTVSAALDTITSIRSGVGALESQFNFAAAALQSSVQNQGAAQSSLLDTDIAAESTNFATEQVKLQAGISVLAQANQQLQALLKLIG